MSNKSTATVATMGIDIGKNSFHVVGLDERGAKNANFKKVWESMLAFRNDQYLWWRVAEYTYDDFLIRNRTRT